ncbi:MAG: hypothetical protein HY914_17165 [Desulfomonile tiedjei]|nr:hypothetical protein [Desulfomonile tiedjei]
MPSLRLFPRVPAARRMNHLPRTFLVEHNPLEFHLPVAVPEHVRRFSDLPPSRESEDSNREMIAFYPDRSTGNRGLASTEIGRSIGKYDDDGAIFSAPRACIGDLVRGERFPLEQALPVQLLDASEQISAQVPVNGHAREDDRCHEEGRAKYAQYPPGLDQTDTTCRYFSSCDSFEVGASQDPRKNPQGPAQE